MSVVHLGQIKKHLLDKYENYIDLCDVKGKKDNIESQTLTRALSAFVIDSASGCGAQNASASIIDGANDNGLDAIYVDKSTNIIYVVQSKWSHSGKGEPSNSEVKKFIAGIKDVLHCNFSRFNEKLNAKKEDIESAMYIPGGRLKAYLAYTGSNQLAEPSKRDIADFIHEVNDISSYLSFTSNNQAELYRTLTQLFSGEPISFDVHLKSWGSIKEPSKAYYGQVNGSELKNWWDLHGISLLSRNIRSSLGDSEVNHVINGTIQNEPENFWYFNNGITLVAKEISKTLAGGGDRDHGIFHCKDVSIVNGAQTLSTLGKTDGLFLDSLSNIFVPVRIISLDGKDDLFCEKITKFNNFQNKIETRDFVSLDPEQHRLRNEFKLEGIDYSIKRDAQFKSGKCSIDVSEATIALSCASGDVSLIVQLKREIGKIWEEIDKPPYKQVFNNNTSSIFLYRSVMINRKIETYLSNIIKTTLFGPERQGIAIHGNRLLAGLVFLGFHKKILMDHSGEAYDALSDEQLKKVIDQCFITLAEVVETHFKRSILPTLFKNKNRCQEIWDHCKERQESNFRSLPSQMSFL